jgi:hypothetical protein
VTPFISLHNEYRTCARYPLTKGAYIAWYLLSPYQYDHASTPLSSPTPRDRHLYESCPATRQRLLVPRVHARAHWHRRETCGSSSSPALRSVTLANRQTTVVWKKSFLPQIEKVVTQRSKYVFQLSPRTHPTGPGKCL